MGYPAERLRAYCAPLLGIYNRAQQAPTATKTAEDGSADSLARVVSSSTWSAEAFAKTAAWLG